MDFKFSDTQELLRRSAREFLEKECTEEVVREVEAGDVGYSPDLWKKMADLGWLGLVFPEQYDGEGMNVVDLAILHEEFGRAMLPCPYMSTVVLSGLTILNAGSDAQKAEHLPGIAKGDSIMALALTEPEASWDGRAWEAEGVNLSATAEGDDYVLDGVKLFVHDANIADTLLVAARTKSGSDPEQGVTLFLVDAKSPGIAVEDLRTVACDNQCEVVFGKVRVPKENILGELDGGWPVLWKSMQIGAVMLSAQMMGAGQRLQDLAVDYARSRIQFDMPIGINQYIQEHCVLLLRDVEGCRWTTYLAARKLAEGEPCDFDVAVAKAWSSDAHESACWRCHQVLAGVGYTMNDGVLPMFSRRGKTLQIYLGDTAFHKEKITQILETWPSPIKPEGAPQGLWSADLPEMLVPGWWDDWGQG